MSCYCVYAIHMHTCAAQINFNKVGVEGAVCVKSPDGSFGVVLPTNTGIVCATCKYGKSTCHHVQRVLSGISCSDEEDIPHVLLPFLPARNKNPKKQMEILPSCISKQRISFKIMPSLAAIMKQPVEQRLNIQNSVCHLKPTSDNTACSKCGCCNWSDLPSDRRSIVIMSKFILQSVGKFAMYFICIVVREDFNTGIDCLFYHSLLQAV